MPTIKKSFFILLFSISYISVQAQSSSFIQKKTHFGYVIFLEKEKADFRNAIFQKESYFWGATFQQEARFWRATFQRKANFGDATFQKETNFGRVTFQQETDFWRTTFLQEADFRRATFQKEADFRNTIFKKGIHFSNARFNRISPRFEDASFFDTIYFENVAVHNLERDISFEWVNDKRSGRYLIEDSIGQPKDISTQVKEIRKLPKDKLSNEEKKILLIADSIDIKLSQKIPIYLYGTDLSKIILPYHKFELVFLPHRQNIESMATVYEPLILKCQQSGRKESAQNWDIEWTSIQYNFTYPRFAPLLNWINTHWWNYGYEKYRILWIWLPGFFFLFVLFNMFALKWLLKKVYFDSALHKRDPSFSEEILVNQKAKNNFIDNLFKQKWTQRVSYTLYYTGLIFFNFRVKYEAVNYKNFGGIIYFYLIYLTGILHIAFSINYLLSV